MILAGRLTKCIRFHVFRDHMFRDVDRGHYAFEGDLVFGTLKEHFPWGAAYFVRPVAKPLYYYPYVDCDQVHWFSPLELLAADLPDWLASQIGDEIMLLNGQPLPMAGDV